MKFRDFLENGGYMPNEWYNAERVYRDYDDAVEATAESVLDFIWCMGDSEAIVDAITAAGYDPTDDDSMAAYIASEHDISGWAQECWRDNRPELWRICRKIDAADADGRDADGDDITDYCWAWDDISELRDIWYIRDDADDTSASDMLARYIDDLAADATAWAARDVARRCRDYTKNLLG